MVGMTTPFSRATARIDWPSVRGDVGTVDAEGIDSAHGCTGLVSLVKCRS